MALPPNTLEICFSFDTTLSMTQHVDQVKARLQHMVQRLQADIAGIRIALFAHGDHYFPDWDNKSPYVIKQQDFTNEIAQLCDFIKGAEETEGGDWEECYEFVLQKANTDLSWSPTTNKIFVLIGDARPHEADDEECNKSLIDWRKELAKLRTRGVRTYGCYCKTDFSGRKDKQFFKELSTKGEGSFLLLEDFNSIFDFMMAICYREHGEEALQAYEAEVRSRDKAAPSDVKNMFTTLKKDLSTSSVTSIMKSLTSKTAPATASKRKRAAKPLTVKATLKTTKTTAYTKRSATQKKVVKNLKAKAPRSLQAPQAKTINKLRRERVPHTNFLLRDYPWSTWKLAFCLKNKDKGWSKRDNGIGYCKQVAFKTNSRGKALYEFAVQPRPGMHKAIVYRTIENGLNGRGFIKLEKSLGSALLRKQLDNVLKQGCSVFVRRLLFKRGKKYESMEENLSIYDYVWVRDGSNGTRDLYKEDFVISQQMNS